LAPLQTGALAKKAYDAVRLRAPKLVEDRPLAPDINAIADLVASGAIARVLH